MKHLPTPTPEQPSYGDFQSWVKKPGQAWMCTTHSLAVPATFTIQGNSIMARRRSNSLSSRRSSRNQGFTQLPFAPLSNPYPPMEIISADQVETIHRASLKILRDIGLRVESPTALKLLTDLRADVDHDTGQVRFDPAADRRADNRPPFRVHHPCAQPRENRAHGWQLHRIRQRLRAILRLRSGSG